MDGVSAGKQGTWRRSAIWALVVLGGILGILFARSFQGPEILFSSDGPLGLNSAHYAALPGAYKGMWQDLYWVGGRVGSAFPSITYALLWVLKPVAFARFYAPISLLLLGLSAWLFFRQLGFRPVVCVLGGVAAALNTDFLSYACWGLGTLTLAVAWTFVALAALVTPGSRCLVLKAALAGLAVGMAVMEGFDSGAILSLYVAAFALCQSLWGSGTAGRRWIEGAWRVALVAVMAGFIAAQALTVLIGTQIQGVVGMQQDVNTKTAHWTEATQWSLPKIETLRVVIPGLFGYRMDTPDGGNYWGRVGEGPGLARHSGSGVYAGVLVVALAFWAMLQALRGTKSIFDKNEQRMVWFWSGCLVVSLLLAWGHWAPFYQLFYALPYASTIRNPIKFMHPCSIALVVLFGYGLEGLWRSYVMKPLRDAEGIGARVRAWWGSAAVFEKRFTRGLGMVLGVTLLGWLLYFSSKAQLEGYLAHAPGLPGDLAPAMAAASLREVGWFLLFLCVTGVLLLLIQAGVLAGRRAIWASICLGILMLSDFSRADAPWIYYWNYKEKYASNPVLDLLRQKPFEHRVVMWPTELNDPQVNQLLGFLHQLYSGEWIQHQFPYYNIQSLDVSQEPRPAAENVAYRKAFYSKGVPSLGRIWQLTNTRYIFGLAGGFPDLLNRLLDPVHKGFHLRAAFTMTQSGTIQTNAEGPFGLVEFDGALPRAKLYSNWQPAGNDDQALARLADPSFDPETTVLVSDSLPAAAAAPATNSVATSAEIVQYAPKDIQLKTSSAAASVLLLNDKFDPHWQVRVDGQPGRLLRCNYLMQGVYLPAGQHQVEFAFQVPVTALWVSVAAIGLGLGLLGLLLVQGPGTEGAKPEITAAPSATGGAKRPRLAGA